MREDFKRRFRYPQSPGRLPPSRKGRVPGQAPPGRTPVMRPPHTLSVVDGELGRGMERKAGHNLPGERRDAGVLHQHGIDSHCVQTDKVPRDTGEFPVMDQRVDRHVDPHAPGMGICDCFRDLVFGKILRKLPCAKLFPAQVDCIGPGGDRGKERLHGAGRREQFGASSFFRGNVCCCPWSPQSRGRK